MDLGPGGMDLGPGVVPKLRREILHLGVWAIPGNREPFKKAVGFAPPTFLRGSRPPGADQTPKIQDFPSQYGPLC